MLNDSTGWAALCREHHTVRQDAFAYGFGTRWQELVDGTRAGTSTLADWSKFLDVIERAAQEEQNIIVKGSTYLRRLAALRAASGDYVCAKDRCDRSAPVERAGQPPNCLLFDLPMAHG